MDTHPDATGRDTSRPVATGRDMDYVLSLDDVAARYAAAGHPRTLRTLQRYCASGHLESQKMATPTGDKYLVTPQSVERHLAQIEELQGLGVVATGRDTPRQVATPIEQVSGATPEGTTAATGPDEPRQAPTAHPDTLHNVARLEREVERLQDDREFLREQLKVKDTQIASLLERDRETNILIRGLQEMLTPLLGPRREPPQADTRDSSL